MCSLVAITDSRSVHCYVVQMCFPFLLKQRLEPSICNKRCMPADSTSKLPVSLYVACLLTNLIELLLLLVRQQPRPRWTNNMGWWRLSIRWHITYVSLTPYSRAKAVRQCCRVAHSARRLAIRPLTLYTLHRHLPCYHWRPYLPGGCCICLEQSMEPYMLLCIWFHEQSAGVS